MYHLGEHRGEKKRAGVKIGKDTKRKIKTKCICGWWCYERPQPKSKEFTRLSYFFNETIQHE